MPLNLKINLLTTVIPSAVTIEFSTVFQRGNDPTKPMTRALTAIKFVNMKYCNFPASKKILFFLDQYWDIMRMHLYLHRLSKKAFPNGPFV